jgi:hypothetical protein
MKAFWIQTACTGPCILSALLGMDFLPTGKHFTVAFMIGVAYGLGSRFGKPLFSGVKP